MRPILRPNRIGVACEPAYVVDTAKYARNMRNVPMAAFESGATTQNS